MFAASIARAQTLSSPSSAYDNLPVTPPPTELSAGTPLTIVPPAQSVEPAPIMEGSIVPAETWTHGGVVHPTAEAPMSHAVLADHWDSGWFAAAELTIVRPVFAVVPVDDREHSVGPRVVVGWEGYNGFGVRGRFWGLENDAKLNLLGLPVDLQTEAARLDLEFYREFDFNRSTITVGASITAAELGMRLDQITSPAEERGAGVGLFVEGQYEITKNHDSTWSLLTRGHWAGLVGEWEDPDNSASDSGDSNLRIGEVALGWQYRHEFDASTLVFQHMLEMQVWNPSYLEDVSFFGQSVSLGLMF
jgi:hypothetical protein